MRPFHTRAGNTLIVVLGVVVIAASMILTATDSTNGSRKLREVALAEQEAAYAAEAVASMVEGKLVNLSGDIENLNRDVTTWYGNSIENFWNLRGYCFANTESIPAAVVSQLTAAGLSGTRNNLGLRFGNCIVRWRLEPMIVLGTRESGAADFNAITKYTDSTRGSTPFAVNYTSNPNDPRYNTLRSSSQWTDGRDNGYFLHFRVVSEAYRLADPSSTESAPWRSAAKGSSVATAQAQRVVQFKLLSLFRYVIFYAANGPTGDLDLWAGADIAINGAVHTNASFYLGGQGSKYLDVNGNDYHDSASSNKTMTLGGSGANQISVTAVDGIFRMRKPVNLYALMKGLSGASTDPMQVPVYISGTTAHALNGNDASSTNITINGQKFTYEVDSRRAQKSAFGSKSLEQQFNNFVKDSRLGARTVRTLSNLPLLAGRPIEHQNLAPEGAPVYVRPSMTLPTVISAISFTGSVAVPSSVSWGGTSGYAQILGNLSLTNAAGYKQLLYTNSARTAFTVTASATTIPVPATNLPLYWQDAALTSQDISPVSTDFPDPFVHASIASGSPGYDGSGFRRNACDGHYCGRARRGQANTTTTGLTIREKPWQNPILAKPFPVELIAVATPGSGYATPPTVTITGGGGYGATATAALSSTVAGQVQSITVTNPGFGYASVPTVTLSAPGGTDTTATATAYLAGGGLTSLNRTAGGSGWTRPPIVRFQGGGGAGATATATISGNAIATVTLINPGFGYTSNPLVFFDRATGDTSGTGGAATAVAQAAPTGPWPEARKRYVDYLNSNYDVFLGKDSSGNPVEISAAFFNQILDPVRAPTVADYIVTEDDFVNLRESTYLAKFYYGTDPTSIPNHRLRNYGVTGLPYRVNVLTLNMRRVQDFLKYRRWDRDVLGNAASTDTAMAKTRFNGAIYAHRTRRSGTYDPILRPGLFFDPLQGKPGLSAVGEVTGPMTTAYSTSDALAFNNSTSLPAANIEPGGTANVFPNLFREGSGPIETFHAGIRLAKADTIDWNHDGDDNGTDEASGTALGRSGLTVITPNPVYLWGDFNRNILISTSGTTESWKTFDSATAAEQANRLPPCGVFADGIVSLTPSWVDADHQVYSGRDTAKTGGTTVFYNTSVVINNIPSQAINALEEGSGAVTNVMRFLENGTRTLNFRGSLVVPNEQRYSKGTLGANDSPQNYNTNFYGAPARNYTFNDDLLKGAGQPPFAPFGMQVTRVLSQIHLNQ